jgi:uncharacterized membrane protein
MTPTAMLALATAAFIATHFVSSTPLRPAMVARIGERPYQGLYTLVAFVTLGWMGWAFAQAPREPLFAGLRAVPYVLMPISFVLLACGFGRNPTIVGAEKLLRSEDPARGMIRVTRHPIMWSFMLFAAAHILARGDLKSLIFFGGLLVVAGLGTILMDARKRSNPDFQRFAAVSSNVPFLAVLQGRNRIVWREIGWLRPAIGIGVYFGVLTVHP